MALINYIGKHNTTFDVSVHSHDYWEIIYCTTGDGTLELLNGTKICYVKGDILAIPPHLKHSNYSNVGFTNLNFTIENFMPHFNDLRLFHDTESMDLFYSISQAHRYFHMQLENKEAIISYLSDLICEYINFCVGLNFCSSYTQVITNEIIANFTNPDFNIDSVYKNIPMNKEYLRKLFTKEKGITPLQFLINQRIDCAKKFLIKNNNLSIKEIAENSGFSDQLYFSRIFKKITGQSPKSYKIPNLNDNKIN